MTGKRRIIRGVRDETATRGRDALFESEAELTLPDGGTTDLYNTTG